jgi:hypothetical protein
LVVGSKHIEKKDSNINDNDPFLTRKSSGSRVIEKKALLLHGGNSFRVSGATMMPTITQTKQSNTPGINGSNRLEKMKENTHTRTFCSTEQYNAAVPMGYTQETARPMAHYSASQVPLKYLCGSSVKINSEWQVK